MQAASLTNYGLARIGEDDVEGSALPSKAELTLMLYKAYADADAENRKKSKEKAAAKKAGAKK